ncbi:uncharacterized protein LOC100137645 isoform X1 [Xenopus laevis]|uniref:Uncharacterized protein LOC100137645 isoform X1 n=2 Tax=Xenopus laevis TaxID=8355 RepID=A0A1L8HNE6_XENLA|nr:uncharacterized protein LOC100137645 isoform X1 [Xenopus laevis]XP_041428185.1 uncharacterized protein LOC100137645 isoform X1 [Xenopus laevis]OCT97597.1 hypothetical protein XELAEV_18009826mg [Xenopus laevis]
MSSSCPSQGLPSSSSRSIPVNVQQHSFDSGLVLRERNNSGCQDSQNDHLDSLDGSFFDFTETLDDSSYEGESGIPDLKLVRKIVSQVEFYLSDENLSHDAFLLKHVQKNKMGYVSIKLLTSFKKIKYLTRDWRKTLYALRFSEQLEVNEEETKVRRKNPLPDYLLGLPPTKQLLAWNILDPEKGSFSCQQKNLMEIVTSFFATYGVIMSIRILKPGKEVPSDIKKYMLRYPELSTKNCALVEYESLEGARKALEALSGKVSSTNIDRIKVIPVSGRGTRKKSVMDTDEHEDLPDKKMTRKEIRAMERLHYTTEDSSFYSSSESDSTPASPVLTPRYLSPLTFSSPSMMFKPPFFSSPRSSTFLARKSLSHSHHNPSPLASELGNGDYPSPGTSPELCRKSSDHSAENAGSSTSPWVQRRRAAAHNLLGEKPLPCSPLTLKKLTVSLGLNNGVIRHPYGPDGSKGFHNCIGRGKLVLRH